MLLTLILSIFVFFFILGNLSLFKWGKTVQIPVPHRLDRANRDCPRQEDHTQDLEEHETILKNRDSQECQSAKDQIYNNYQFKKQREAEHGLPQTLTAIPTQQFAKYEDATPKAPELEQFEDYAPIDLPLPAAPMDKGHMRVKKETLPEPGAINSYEPLHQAKFSSEYRSPFSEKKGKDDLSNFFDTYKFVQGFDTIQRQKVACPTQWEQPAHKIQNSS
uniref:Uncharacterized protein n=1 Tax=viral metagenome TaxID=1070528 RepID=A0A6C0BKC8_9ZZZZ